MQGKLFGTTTVILLSFGWLSSQVAGDDWPQWRGPQRDGIWRETGVVEKFERPELEIKWRREISSGYGHPTVADGRVFVTDRVVDGIKQLERIHCFEAMRGYRLWLRSYETVYEVASHDAGPRNAVTVHDGRAYSLGTMGHMFCLDAASGDVVWKRDLYTEYKIRMPKWGLCASPLIHGDLVSVQIGGSDGACIVAFDRVTGAEKWRALDDPASYSSPILIEQAGRMVLVCWTGDQVAGLDPDTGKLFWGFPTKPTKFVRHCPSPVWNNGRLFMSSFFDGALMLKLDPGRLAVEKVWSRIGKSEKPNEQDGLHSNVAEAFFLGDEVYGVDSYGEVRCLAADTGERLWERVGDVIPQFRWSTLRFVQNGDKFWLFTDSGELIICRLSRDGYEEISRAKLIEPTKGQQPSSRTGVCWSHPAFAYQHVFARSDKEIVCASLKAE